MLRYLASGRRDLAVAPIMAMTRFNWEFYVLLSGSLRPTGAKFGEETFTGTPALWVFAPDTPHGWQSQGVLDRVVFHFSSVPDLVREACGDRGFLRVELNADECQLVERLAVLVEPHYRTPTPVSVLHFDRALIDLSLIVLKHLHREQELPLETVAFERVERAIEWYLSHLHERPTLEALADVVHVSAAHLRRQFRLVYNQSPHHVLTHLRLERASQILASTGDTLEQVAKKSGFNSASDLCRVFKRRYKVYPNEWRTQISGQERPRHQLERLIARVDPSASELIALRRKRTRGTRRKAKK